MHVIRSSIPHDHSTRSEALNTNSTMLALVSVSGDDLSSARLQTPTAHSLQVGISIRKVPANDDPILAATDNSASIELQLEHPVAAFAMVDGIVVGGLVGGLVVGVRMCLCVCKAVSLRVY
jgi:hypothetical protein